MHCKSSGWVTSLAVHGGLLLLLGVLSLPIPPLRDVPLEIRIRPRQESPPAHVMLFDAPMAVPAAAPVTLTRETPLNWTSSSLRLADLPADLPPVGRARGTHEMATAPAPPGQGSSGGTTFFGIPAYGNEFVYVLDISTSMRARTATGLTRFETAARELLRSVSKLKEDQSFLVILFCYRTLWMTDAPRLLRATAANKSRLRSWLYRVQLAPGTDPRWGLVTGLRLGPDALFLLSDGEFNGRRKNLHALPGNPLCELLIRKYRRPGTPIHTIAFAKKGDRARLAAIAQDTGGRHRFVGQADR